MHYRKPVIKTHGGAKEHEDLFPLSKMERRCRALALALAIVPLFASALAPTSTQEDTLKELIDVVEERHYASRRYDDALSAQHFIAYLDALDSQRMFFDAADITEFSSWKLGLDNAGRRGNLDPAFTMFNRYHEKLKSRLENALATLAQTLKGFDYELDEYLVIDHSTMPWAPNAEELDERWRRLLRHVGGEGAVEGESELLLGHEPVLRLHPHLPLEQRAVRDRGQRELAELELHVGGREQVDALGGRELVRLEEALEGGVRVALPVVLQTLRVVLRSRVLRGRRHGRPRARTPPAR